MNDNLNIKDVFARLAAPFNPEDIEWRAGATNAEKTRALALAYITSRAVMDRLDEAISPENWRDEYKAGPDGGVICGLSLRINGEWITKWDGAENTDFEAIKGGLSDAFKRAGYKWGIGRYLYRLESAWVACEARGKTISLKSTPPLPAWALPQEVSQAKATPNVASQPTSSQREKQILQEMGYENAPAPVQEKPKVTPKPVSVAPIPGKNGKEPKAAAPAPTSKPPLKAAPAARIQTSWSADVVLAVVDARLAPNAQQAVLLLNQAGLTGKVTSEQAVSAVRKHLSN